MKLTPSAGRRLKVRSASARSGGSPQTPGPVTRIEPKPRRQTSIAPPILKVIECTAACAMALLRQRDLAHVVLPGDVAHPRIVVLRDAGGLLLALRAPLLHERFVASLVRTQGLGVLELDDQHRVEAATLAQVAAIDVVLLDL